MAVTFTLRAKQGVKVGTYISDDFGAHTVDFTYERKVTVL